jgi:hypothetical protein
MTDWRAVVYGFGVQFVLGVFAFAIPVVGHAAAGLLGGVVAGYVAGGGLGRGTWHGLIAGALGGLVLAVLFSVGASVLGVVGLGPLGGLAGLGVFLVGVFVALALAIDSAVGGLVGALLA